MGVEVIWLFYNAPEACRYIFNNHTLNSVSTWLCLLQSEDLRKYFLSYCYLYKKKWKMHLNRKKKI